MRSRSFSQSVFIFDLKLKYDLKITDWGSVAFILVVPRKVIFSKYRNTQGTMEHTLHSNTYPNSSSFSFVNVRFHTPCVFVWAPRVLLKKPRETRSDLFDSPFWLVDFVRILFQNLSYF